MRRWEDLREVILQGLTDAPDIATLAEQFFVNLLTYRPDPIWETLHALKVTDYLETFGSILYSRIQDILQNRCVSPKFWKNANQ
jgi:hypothetical protein